jgi:ribonuclease HI
MRGRRCAVADARSPMRGRRCAVADARLIAGPEVGEEMRDRYIEVFTDASVQPRATGLGVVVKDARGRLIAWENAAAGVMTCNEAEYAALIYALEWLARSGERVDVDEVRIFLDSRVVVEQMRGWVAVRNPRLRPLHAQAQALARRLEGRYARMTFVHIPRERNQLADAIADDALGRGKRGAR